MGWIRGRQACETEGERNREKGKKKGGKKEKSKEKIKPVTNACNCKQANTPPRLLSRLGLEIFSLTGNQQPNNQSKQAQHAAKDLDDQDLDKQGGISGIR